MDGRNIKMNLKIETKTKPTKEGEGEQKKIQFGDVAIKNLFTLRIDINSSDKWR